VEERWEEMTAAVKEKGRRRKSVDERFETD